MAKANPKAWFPGHIAKIYFRKVDKWAMSNAKWRPYFPTWGEAHAHMTANAAERVKKAERELASARRSQEKINAMKEPTT